MNLLSKIFSTALRYGFFFLAAGLIQLACQNEKNDTNQANIVLISLDTLRADHLGCYGYFRDTSPNIDAFAEESIFFERCIVPMATTLPSHAAILTGTYPLENGVIYNTVHGGSRFVTTPTLRSFAELCAEDGYSTAAFISAAALKKGTGIEIGFQVFDECAGPERRAAATTNAALNWLNKLDRTPYFLWVHYYDPHFPFSPPRPYQKLFTSDPGLEAFIKERKVAPTGLRPLVEVRDRARQSINAYDGEIRYLDDQLARLLNRLKELPNWDRTVVLLVGDHGEGLCQHNETAHGGTWNEQLHAPMMLRVPGQPPRRVASVVSCVDALPTMLGLIDLPGLDPLLKQASGRDLLHGQFQAAPVLSQDTGRLIDEPGYRYTLTSDRWKYFLLTNETAGDRLYDLQNDPFELHDQSQEKPELVQGLKRSLLELIQQQQKRRGVLLGDADTIPENIDPALQEQLRALGYVDDGK